MFINYLEETYSFHGSFYDSLEIENVLTFLFFRISDSSEKMQVHALKYMISTPEETPKEHTMGKIKLYS